jgi:hypothetical protein
MSGVVSGTGEGSSGTSAELSGDSAESVGITTTGITPLERRDATMMVMGSDRLVLIGGTTIEDGHDQETGGKLSYLGLSCQRERLTFTSAHTFLCTSSCASRL